MSSRLVLIGGGVRSGKSAHAVRLAQRSGAAWTFVATAEARDDEMRARILRHRQERGENVVTLEAPREVPSALKSVVTPVVVVDCLTLWLSNLLCAEVPLEQCLAEVAALITAVRAQSLTAYVVTNEVGMGLVPPSPLGRAFRDIAGWAHQRLADAAEEVHFAVMGQMLRIKPSTLTTEVNLDDAMCER